MSRRSEYLSAAAWAAFGVLVAVAAWRLDRLENLGINPWTVPGLLPGLVGVLIVILALVLAVQAGGPRSAGPRLPPGTGESVEAGPVPPQLVPGGASRVRTLVAGTMCVLFAGVSPGRGLPFPVEAAAFIFLFIAVFSWPGWRARSRVLRGLVTALVIAVAAAGLISWLFESVFLVRLP